MSNVFSIINVVGVLVPCQLITQNISHRLKSNRSFYLGNPEGGISRGLGPEKYLSCGNLGYKSPFLQVNSPYQTVG